MDFIDFPDNTNVIELIDHKATGVLTTLMDQCRTPGGTDSSFAEAMYKSCGNLDRFEASDLQRGHRQFTVLHFAGPVIYDTEGYVEKNKDEIPRGASKLLRALDERICSTDWKDTNTAGRCIRLLSWFKWTGSKEASYYSWKSIQGAA